MAPPKKACPDGIRECTECFLNLPVAEFKHGKSYCYECSKKVTAAWKARNKEHISAYNKEYKALDEDARKEWFEKKRAEREQASEARAAHRAAARKLRASFHMLLAQWKRPRKSMQAKVAKYNRTDNVMGCTLEFFLAWMEYCLELDMTMENHGTVWHIDHVVPIDAFDMTRPQDATRCFHWTNTQPLHSRTNHTKCTNVREAEVVAQQARVGMFLGERGLLWDGCYTLL